jgi:hypothetical protein
VILRARLGPQKYGKGRQPPIRKSAKGAIRGKMEAAGITVIKAIKGIQTSESKRRISPKFPATTGHAATASASTLMRAVIVTMGQKEIMPKQQVLKLQNHQCL